MMKILMNCWFIVVGLFIASIILERFLAVKYIRIIQLIVSLIQFILFGVSIIYMLTVYAN